ncbi:MAG: LON peptidase substrate-binding domain-containing protein [Candidatus Lambdaproteobacteria bacterium]|nr:LON peptidase substrate-binding domain-containing protein [Candidatus Lambdaproteobacteria bacterium]
MQNSVESNEGALPEVFPVFPLTGALLLPGSTIPFHIFEQRYRNMMEDALAERLPIGLVQPFVPQQDNRPLPGAELQQPELYRVGCAGRLERCEKTEDGRYLIVLLGISRFRILEELPLQRGYRRVRAAFGEFAADRRMPLVPPNAERLLEALAAFGRHHRIQFDVASLRSAQPLPLLNGLSMSLPFTPVEKQALLEAPDVAEREKLLLALLGMNVDSSLPGHYEPPPSIN